VLSRGTPTDDADAFELEAFDRRFDVPSIVRTSFFVSLRAIGAIFGQVRNRFPTGQPLENAICILFGLT
jgi:hypothetical protein